MVGRGVRRALLMTALVAMAGPVVATGHAQCLSHATGLESSNCTSAPPPPRDNAKSFEAVVIGWGAGSFLFLSDGNELLLFDVSNAPTSPARLPGSTFEIGHLGDSDYDLMSFEVCHDCRFGIANHKLGTVIFDLGTDPARPRFGTDRYFPEGDGVRGGMVFSHAGRSYVLANDLSPLCGGASLFEVTNPGGIELEHVDCLEVPGVQSQVLGGFKVGETHLYVGDRSGAVHIVELVEGPGGLGLQYLGAAPFRANQQRGKGFDLDPAAGLVVSQSSDMWVDLYDVGGSFDPQASVTSPVRLARLGPPSAPVTVNRRVAIRYPLVYGAYQGTNLAPEIFDVASPRRPVGPLDPGYWDPSNSWNDWDCRREYDGAFHPSTGALYLARYQVAQVVDTGDCFDPTVVFGDDFEDGTTGAWSEADPE